MKKKAKVIAPVLPPSHLARIDALKLRVICYRHEHVACAVEGDTEPRNEWLPRDIVAEDGKSVIIFRETDSHYACDGYEPWHDGMHGGRCESIHSALCWIETARDIRAGKRDCF